MHQPAKRWSCTRPCIAAAAAAAPAAQAIWDELPDDAKAYGARATGQKKRAFTQLVTPERPIYFRSYAESSNDISVDTSAVITGACCMRMRHSAGGAT